MPVLNASFPARLRVVALAGIVFAGAAASAPMGSGLIYSCTDNAGRKITRDRYIVECSSREQRVLNSDGSLREIRSPTMTAEERLTVEERERDGAVALRRHQEESKRDRNLINRFPNEAAHRKARELALANVRNAMRASEERIAVLAVERKPMMTEAEFYVGKQLPLKLKLALDSNDASGEAQRTLMQNQQAEILRIESVYDAELGRLRALWSGTQPGTLGPMAQASAPPARK